jgi:tetratricopeptide (TPR) repeat protein
MAPTAPTVGTITKGMPNASRLAWRDWWNTHHHHHHIIFFFYNPFWPYFAYNPFWGYSAVPQSYCSMPYACTSSLSYDATDSYGTAGMPLYTTPTSPSDAAKSDQQAAPSNDPYEFARQGEEAFKGRDYAGATRAWRHAVVDDPRNGGVLLRLAQALFATGEYDEAAGATQQGLTVLPEEKWQSEASSTMTLYMNPQDYNDQLKGLEGAVKATPDDAALRFELAFQYAFSNRRGEAVRELDKLLQIAPQDQIGRRLRDLVSRNIADSPLIGSPSTKS